MTGNSSQPVQMKESMSDNQYTCSVSSCKRKYTSFKKKEYYNYWDSKDPYRTTYILVCSKCHKEKEVNFVPTNNLLNLGTWRKNDVCSRCDTWPVPDCRTCD